uniref:UBC core domain-containing protein n=1 Tax=viral metagenome TaxID=1070528 RepID=A0A6C0D5R5_9ZZZZ
MNAKRLQKEFVQLQDKTLKETGIYYFIEGDNMLKATAFMFGPKGTPYEFCPLEYNFTIPDDYPFMPPKVLYRTNDGRTRFHPNFYVDGKVCLSILGTYSGPKWASSMNISTVLLSIYSLMTENPLIHEPCYENTRLSTPKNQQYADYIEHQMIQLFIKSIQYNYYKKYTDLDEEFKNKLLESYELIKKKVESKTEHHDVTYTLLPYSMFGSTSWKKLHEEVRRRY